MLISFFADVLTIGINCFALLNYKRFPGLSDGSRLEKIFSMGINSMSLAVWLGEDRKCSAAVVGLDLLLGLSMVRRCF